MSDERAVIFVAKDEVPILRFIKNVLEQMDIVRAVETARDGEAALHAIAALRPDIAITDIMMPRMSGLELIRGAQVVSPATRFIVLTGYERFDFARTALELRALNYLLKPIDVEKLQTSVMEAWQSILNERAGDAVKRLRHVYLNDVKLAQSTEANEHVLVKQIMHYLDENFRKELDRDKMSEHFGYNKNYLTTVFSRNCGLSPGQYVTKRRVEMAREILRADPAVRMKDVARMVGYEDALYFSRVFKSHTGMSPSEFGQSKEE